MTGHAPTVTLTVNPAGPYLPGTYIAAKATISDVDTTSSAYVDSLGRDVTVTRVDVEKIAWSWKSGTAMTPAATGDNPETMQVPAVSDVLLCTVTDRQGNTTTASCPVTVRAPMLVGAAVAPYPNSKRTLQQEYDAYVADCGHLDYLRVYLNATESTIAAFPITWPVPGEVTDYATRRTMLSIKFDMAALAAGKYDAAIRKLIAAYPGEGLDLIPWHEPEDDIAAGKLKLADWRAGVAHLVQLVAAIGDPRVQVWVVLMDFTFDSASGRHPDDYWVPGVDGYGIDSYNVPSVRHDGMVWKTPAQLADRFVVWADGYKVAKGWIEVGCAPDFADPTRRPAWLVAHGQYTRQHNFIRASYWDETGPKGDWQVRAVIKRGAYYPTSPLGAITSITTDTASAAAWRKAIGR